jgi:hypothetical protein
MWVSVHKEEANMHIYRWKQKKRKERVISEHVRVKKEEEPGVLGV